MGDFIVALVDEVEVLDINDFFYNLYMLIVEYKTAVSRVDLEGKFVQKVARIQNTLRMLQLNMMMDMDTESLMKILQEIQRDEFWERLKSVLKAFNVFSFIDLRMPMCSSYKCLGSILPSLGAGWTLLWLRMLSSWWPT